MATMTYDADWGFHRYDALGFSGPLVSMKSPAFFSALVKFAIWSVVMLMIPVVATGVGILALNWVNHIHSFNNGVITQGWPLVGFAGLIVLAGFAACAVIAGAVTFALLGMFSAFQDEPFAVSSSNDAEDDWATEV